MAETRRQFVAFVKRECPTCALVVPVLTELASCLDLTVVSQDDPTFPPDLPVTGDTDLDLSWQHRIETVPTLLRLRDGVEEQRAIGWHREEWVQLTGVRDLGGN